MPGIMLIEHIQIVTMCDRGILQEEIVTVTGHAYFSVNGIVSAYHHEGRLENLPWGMPAENDSRRGRTHPECSEMAPDCDCEGDQE